MNSILRGDGDYVSMFIASQRVQKEMEEKIQQTVRGPVTEDATEESEADGEAGGNQEVVDETSEDRSVKTSEDSEGIEQDESIDDTSEKDDSIPPAEEQESSEVPYPPEADPFNFFERARLYGAEAIVNGTYDGHEGAVEDDGDDDPEAPIIIAVNDGSAPAEEQKPRELTTEGKIDLIRNDPELQRLIHDAARDIAISRPRLWSINPIQNLSMSPSVDATLPQKSLPSPPTNSLRLTIPPDSSDVSGERSRRGQRTNPQSPPRRHVASGGRRPEVSSDARNQLRAHRHRPHEHHPSR